MITALIFIAVLAVLVLTHEFGHFIVARLNGMKVEEFGFGFPPRAVGFRRITTPAGTKWHIVWGNKRVEEEVHQAEHVPGTVYSINWLPLGGFVKIKGEDSLAASAQDPDSFVVKKPWQKMSVLIAGVAMNIFTSIVLLTIGYSIGMPQAAADGEKLPNSKLEIMELLPDKPAQQAGLKPGDVFVQIDNLSNPSMQEFQNYVNSHKNDDLTVTVNRAGTTIVKTMHPIIYPDTGRAGIGVGLAEVGIVRYPWYRAIYFAVQDTWYYVTAIFAGLYMLLRGLFTGAGAAGVSGPVGVAVMTGTVARMGLVYLLQFMAVLSVNLAVLNVLPIPALDGGRLLFVIISKVMRKPVTPALEQRIHMIGFIVLLLLVLLVTIRDVGGLFHKVV